MAGYPGNTEPMAGGVDVLVPDPGRTTGYSAPFSATWDITAGSDLSALQVPGISGANFQPGTPPTAPVGGTVYDANRDDLAGIGADWWEGIHILPRTPLNFGNILAQVDLRFELYNASRDSDRSISSVFIPVSGITIPDFPSLPYVLPSQTSIIDPLSTALDPMGQIVRATPQGEANFDDEIIFTVVSVGDRFLGIVGARIVLLPAEFDGDVEETLAFQTLVMASINRSEQRVKLRKNPRQEFRVDLLAIDEERQQIHNQLLEWQGQSFGLPLWHERLYLSSPASTAGTTLTVASTANADFRVGGQVVVFSDRLTFDVVEIDSITATTIELVSGLANDYPSRTIIAPVRVARITAPVGLTRFSNGSIEGFSLQFEVENNDTDPPTADVSSFNSYDGEVLLDDDNFIRDTYSQQSQRSVVVIDPETGVTYKAQNWSTSRITGTKTWITRNRAELYAIRRLLYAIGGQWKAFWVPSSADDLTVTQDLQSGTATVTVSWVGYTRFVRQREPRRVVVFEFTDGTSLVRVVQGSVEVSGAEEQLTLDVNWPSARTVDEIVRVQFYQRVRFSSDRFRILHTAPGRARISAPFLTI